MGPYTRRMGVCDGCYYVGLKGGRSYRIGTFLPYGLLRTQVILKACFATKHRQGEMGALNNEG